MNTFMWNARLDASSWNAWSLKMGKIVCPETSVRNYKSILHKILKKHIFRAIIYAIWKACFKVSIITNVDVSNWLQYCKPRIFLFMTAYTLIMMLMIIIIKIKIVTNHVFWDVTICRLVSTFRRPKRNYCTAWPWKWRHEDLPKRPKLLNIRQNTQTFSNTAMWEPHITRRRRRRWWWWWRWRCWWWWWRVDVNIYIYMAISINTDIGNVPEECFSPHQTAYNVVLSVVEIKQWSLPFDELCKCVSETFFPSSGMKLSAVYLPKPHIESLRPTTLYCIRVHSLRKLQIL